MRGHTVCRNHGALSPRGVASPAFKTGRYSRSLPARLVGRYQEAVADPELLSLRDDLALIDSRTSALLQRVDSGESGARWDSLRAAYADLEAAIRAGDAIALQSALSEMERLIKRGHSDYSAWGEVESLLDQRRRTVESEQRRLVAMEQMITTSDAMTLATALLSAVKQVVTDRGALSAIQEEFLRITTQRPGLPGGDK